MTQSDLLTLLPLIFLTAWACVLLLVDLFIPKGRKGWTAFLAAVGLAMAMGLTLAYAGQERFAFSGMVVLDGFSSFLSVLFLATGLLGIALAYGYLKRMGIERGEYYALLLFSVTGMMLMAQAADLIVIFLALELLSIPLYVLSAFARPRLDSEEAGLKYFLLGAFSTGFVVYGIALVFGATGVFSNGASLNITANVTYSSSDASVASINQQGLLTGLRPGNVTITASANGVSGNVSLTVSTAALFDPASGDL